MRARLRGTEIYFDVEGMGLVPDGNVMRERPVALLIHGGPGGDHSGFKPAFTPLAHSMQLVYFDHRGQGRSAEGDPDRYTLDENVEDMEALRQHLGPRSDRQHWHQLRRHRRDGARHPVSRQRLAACADRHRGSWRFHRASQADSACAWHSGTAACLRHALGGRARYGGTAVAVLRRHGTALRAQLRRRFRRRRPRSRHQLTSAAESCLRPGRLPAQLRPSPPAREIMAPTLILAGRHDWICAPEFSEEIHRHIPGSVLRIFENSSHSIRSDEPQAMIEAIAEFVARNG